MYKIFVRWNKDGQGYHQVDLALGDEIIKTSTTFCNNNDRVYGYCQGLVDGLSALGHQIKMPQCLTERHLCADESRED